MSKKIISLEISDELKEALRTEAYNKKITVSALIRQILETNMPSRAEKQESRKQ